MSKRYVTLLTTGLAVGATGAAIGAAIASVTFGDDPARTTPVDGPPITTLPRTLPATTATPHPVR